MVLLFFSSKHDLDMLANALRLIEYIFSAWSLYLELSDLLTVNGILAGISW